MVAAFQLLSTICLLVDGSKLFVCLLCLLSLLMLLLLLLSVCLLVCVFLFVCLFVLDSNLAVVKNSNFGIVVLVFVCLFFALLFACLFGCSLVWFW